MISDRAIRSAAERFRIARPAGDAAGDLEIVLDASLSMTSGDASKEELARELCILLLRMCEAAAVPATLVAVKGGGRDRMIAAADASRIALVAFDGVEPLIPALVARAATAPRVHTRVVVSDFLLDGDVVALVKGLADGSSHLWLVQLLDEEDRHPTVGGQLILQDLETEQTVEVVLDEQTVAGYLERLSQLCESLAASCRAAGATFVTASAAVGLERLCDESLVPAGLVLEQTSPT